VPQLAGLLFLFLRVLVLVSQGGTLQTRNRSRAVPTPRLVGLRGCTSRCGVSGGCSRSRSSSYKNKRKEPSAGKPTAQFNSAQRRGQTLSAESNSILRWMTRLARPRRCTHLLFTLQTVALPSRQGVRLQCNHMTGRNWWQNCHRIWKNCAESSYQALKAGPAKADGLSRWLSPGKMQR
jgi:hypothetical protein